MDIDTDKELTFVLNTLQHQLLRSNGALRYTRWMGKVTLDVTSDDVRELQTRIQAWEQYSGQDVGSEDSDRLIAREAALNWGAKIICTLASELETRRAGSLAYQNTFENDLLPWQCMNFIVSG